MADVPTFKTLDSKRKVNIVITGQPGTGKTTIANLLSELLRYHGFEHTIEETEESTPMYPATTNQLDMLAQMVSIQISTMDTLPEKYRPKKRIVGATEEVEKTIYNVRLRDLKLK